MVLDIMILNDFDIYLIDLDSDFRHVTSIFNVRFNINV